MPRELTISIGQHSDRGRKDTNQDFHGALIPTEPLLSLKALPSSSPTASAAARSAAKPANLRSNRFSPTITAHPNPGR
jgi:hypothetical protein